MKFRSAHTIIVVPLQYRFLAVNAMVVFQTSQHVFEVCNTLLSMANLVICAYKLMS